MTPTEDRLAITDVLVRYATGIDSRDWPLFRSCFTDDASLDYGPVGRWEDPDELTAFMRASHSGPTLHRLSNFVLRVDGDHATARTYVHAVVSGPGGFGVTESFGWYDDRLRRTGDGWRIEHRRVDLHGIRLPGPLRLLPPTLAVRAAGLGARAAGRRGRSEDRREPGR